MSEIERWILRILMASRWLLVPLYMALMVLLALFVVMAVRKVYQMTITVLETSEIELVLAGLRIIDVTLVASLILMVMLSGYENYVVTVENPDGDRTRRSWMRRLDSATVKVRIAVAIVAVSAIDLLHTYMDVEQYADHMVLWRVVIHLTLLATAVAVAVLDRKRTEMEDGGH
jgi:uncharacterized protein (TIGR00645 family)